MNSLEEDFPNFEQSAIIDSVLNKKNRITIVRACPGSGKTRLFDEILRKIETNWPARGSGIAALSFTNVAQEEITKSLGQTLSYPHFVGTLDSFMFRYVVRPFGHLAGLNKKGPRLIPSPIDEIIENPKTRVGPKPGDEESIFRIRFVDGSEDSPNLVIKDRFSGSYSKIENKYSRKILNKKQEEWSHNGRITHSDCQYLSSEILNDRVYGGAVSSIIVRRFPVILIDEFQDTGWFLGRALAELLCNPSVSGLIVGDPDQAIFEFSGARPTLFDDVENLYGAKTYPLTRTQRCSKRIASVVSALSDSRAPTVARDDAEEGRVIMIVHGLERVKFDDSIAEEIHKVLKENESLAIIARRGSTVKKLIGFENTDGFAGSCRYGEQVYQAVQQLFEGKSANASRIVSKVMGDFVLGEETPSVEYLRKNNIDIRKWRASIHTVIKAAITGSDGETWNEWLLRIKENVGIAAKEIGWIEDRKRLSSKFHVSQKKGNAKRNLIKNYCSNPGYGDRTKITTIHQVKGEGFDCVVLFVPKPHASNSPCPSKEWWSEPPCEERRVAFVAISRAKKTFILCIHKESYTELARNVPEFVGLFELINLANTGPAKKKNPNQSNLLHFL